MLHGVLGQIVGQARGYTEADDVGVLGSLLAGVGMVIGPDPHVMVGSTRHSLLCWPLLFGSSGSGRKGEATATARQFLNSSALEFSSLVVGGLSSGEGLIERLKDPVEVDPDSKRKQPEWLGTDDKRLLVIESEFGSVLARAKREGSTLTSVLRQAWDGDRLSVMNRAALTASSSHVALIGHITPKEFRLRLAEADMAGGLYNRFLPLYVEKSKRLPRPDPIPPELVFAATEQLRQCIGRARRVGQISLGPDAGELWDNELYDEFAGDDEETVASEFLRRSAPNTLRVAALYAALDGSDQITAEQLTAVGALVRYAVGSARYVLGHASRDVRIDRIRRRIEESPSGYLTRVEVSDLFGRNLKADLLDELIEQVLADDTYAATKVASTGGRPALVYGRADLLRSFVPPNEDQRNASDRPGVSDSSARVHGDVGQDGAERISWNTIFDTDGPESQPDRSVDSGATDQLLDFTTRQPGRCHTCGWHTASQGHQPTCTQRKTA